MRTNPSRDCQGVYDASISNPLFSTFPKFSETVVKPVEGAIPTLETKSFVMDL